MDLTVYTTVSQTELQSRQQSEGQPGQYISDTFRYIKAVKNFCDRETEWTRQRESEIKEMMAPKTWIDTVCRITHYCGLKKPKNSLGVILRNTLEGLQDLHSFLDAVEKLAVTSPFVFMDESFPLEGVNAEAVQSVISAARTVSPLLIPFKREDRAFFSPEPENVDLLVHQLHKYISVMKSLCKEMRSSRILEVTGIYDHTSQLSLSTDHLNQLSRIRMDESFRLTYLFDAQEFVNVYTNTDVSQSLSSLEANAVCLDRMKCAYSFFTIIGSSIGIVGGSLSITGILEGSLSFGDLVGPHWTLTWWGSALGVVSAFISLFTGVAELTVNTYCVREAKVNIDSLMIDMQKVVDCLEQAASSQRPAPHLEEANIELGAMKVISHCRTILKGFDTIMDGTAVAKPDYLVSKVNTNVFFAGNILSLLSDLVFFCKELCSICGRKKSNVSQLICSRTALWRSEMEDWKIIYDYLCKDEEKFQNYKDKLEIRSASR